MRSISNEVHANANDALTDWLVADRHERERERREAKRLRKMKVASPN